MDPELQLLPVRIAVRNTSLGSYIVDGAHNVLFIANPSGLHARCIAEGVQSGFCAIAADKPVCVDREELHLLRDIPIPVTVFHGYRTMWGTQTIKKMIEAGDLGNLFGFESRYWQSSSASMALQGIPEKRQWKNDPRLNGPTDALIDLGSHVVDICLYLMADKPVSSSYRLFYWNSNASHRDTHVHLYLKFADDRNALASISKTVHGATNNFEYTVIGARGSASWKFMQPDEVEYGTGNGASLIRRDAPNPSSGSSPFHGHGWIEGYIEITHQTLRQAAGLSWNPVPTLKESLDAMDVLLNAEIGDI
jgi:predicted dehydrogenase